MGNLNLGAGLAGLLQHAVLRGAPHPPVRQVSRGLGCTATQDKVGVILRSSLGSVLITDFAWTENNSVEVVWWAVPRLGITGLLWPKTVFSLSMFLQPSFVSKHV